MSGEAWLPLEGHLVIELAQFLSGPSAGLRLADLGARVIKVERPVTGEICRSLYLSDTSIAGDSTLFHAINRGKESFAADLKDQQDLDAVRALLARADIVIQNFRPGVAERLGVDFARVRMDNPRVVYGCISGYGEEGPWAQLPGQDLLAQAVSGLMWLSGDRDQGPVPMGLAIADILAGHLLVEGLLAALVRRGRTGEGALVETSLLEALLDLQFEVLTTHLNDGGRPPVRGAVRNAHAYLGAPYGVYETSDGYLAIAMADVIRLAEILGVTGGSIARSAHSPFSRRDELRSLFARRLAEKATEHWLSILRGADIWCAPVLDWPALMTEEAFTRLDMLQTLKGRGASIETTRTAIRLDGKRTSSVAPAPAVGAHNAQIREEFEL